MPVLNRLGFNGFLCVVSCAVHAGRPLSRPEPTQLEIAASSSELRARVVACELIDGAAVKVWVELTNPSVTAVGVVLPTIASGHETPPEFAEFQDAMDTPRGLGEVVLASTQCGPAPGTRLTLEQGQSVTRSVVFPIARWEKAVATESTVRWRWREFNLERPYEEAPASACVLVALGVDQGRCSLKAERTVRCPRGGPVDAYLEQSAAESPRK